MRPGDIPAPTGESSGRGWWANVVDCRDIPAPTGESDGAGGHPGGGEGHPRTYGGIASRSGTTASPSGTSPHLRGNPHLLPAVGGGVRDIPAPTGESHRVDAGHVHRRGHPRTYGGTVTFDVVVPDGQTWGHPRTYGGTTVCDDATSSSHSPGHPRTYGGIRGRWFRCRRPLRGRDIPAPTGEPGSSAKGQGSGGDGDIPAPTGEPTQDLRPIRCRIRHRQGGTSPHLRGNPCPGSSGFRAEPGTGHPRTYGGTLPGWCGLRLRCPGTSPHLRGNHRCPPKAGQCDTGGDIPAPTGERRWRNHGCAGTSPHLRGNRCRRDVQTAGGDGDIPAPTGEPTCPCRVINPLSYHPLHSPRE